MAGRNRKPVNCGRGRKSVGLQDGGVDPAVATKPEDEVNAKEARGNRSLVGR
jgi:hypothetical protein